MSALQRIALGQIMSPRLGSVDPAAFPREEFELYSIPAFDNDAPEILEGSKIGSAKQIVRPGDVLLSRIVPHIRRAWVVGPDRGRRIIASGEWLVFRGEKVEPRYLRHVLVSNPFHAEFMRTVSGVGGSLLRARPAYVADIQIPLPSLSEQRRIAEILDKAEALLAGRRTALAQLDTLTQSIFLDMFGDPAENLGKWPVCPLVELLSTPLRNGVSPSTGGAIAARVLTLSAITGEEFECTAWKTGTFHADPDAEHRVGEQDFLICRGNGNVRLVGRGRFPVHQVMGMVFPDTIIAARFLPERTERSFLQHLWRSNSVRKQIEAAARTTNGTFKVNQKMLEGIKLIVPPIALQQKFARRMTAVEKLRTLQRDALSRLEALFAALQHRAFRGELFPSPERGDLAAE